MRLFVADQPQHDGPKGGVELLYDGIREVASGTAWSDVRLGSRAEALRAAQASGPDPLVVWTQTGGLLGPAWQEWFGRLHAAGARTLETVVFAQPSAYRPRGEQHRTLLLSRDGVDRFVLRSRFAGVALPATLGVLGNPMLQPLSAADHLPREDGVLRLLRVGRPDPRKWSRFELDVCAALAARHPGLRFELTLIGAPYDRPTAPPANLLVTSVPYTRAPLAPFYAAADVYLHHSRIGETFGNTVSEAWAAGALVCCGLDPVWDCAPMDFLVPPHVLGSPEALTRQAADGTLLPRLLTAAPPWAGLSVRDFLEGLHALAQDDVPPLCGYGTAASLSALRRQARTLGAHPVIDPARAVAREVYRQQRNRRTAKEPFV